MVYAAVICSTLQQNQQLYLVRPVPSVCVDQFRVFDQLALIDPGIAAGQCFNSLRWYVRMCVGLMYACPAINESMVHAAARAGANSGGAGGLQGWA